MGLQWQCAAFSRGKAWHASNTSPHAANARQASTIFAHTWLHASLSKCSQLPLSMAQGFRQDGKLCKIPSFLRMYTWNITAIISSMIMRMRVLPKRQHFLPALLHYMQACCTATICCSLTSSLLLNYVRMLSSTCALKWLADHNGTNLCSHLCNRLA